MFVYCLFTILILLFQFHCMPHLRWNSVRRRWKQRSLTSTCLQWMKMRITGSPSLGARSSRASRVNCWRRTWNCLIFFRITRKLTTRSVMNAVTRLSLFWRVSRERRRMSANSMKTFWRSRSNIDWIGLLIELFSLYDRKMWAISICAFLFHRLESESDSEDIETLEAQLKDVLLSSFYVSPILLCTCNDFLFSFIICIMFVA